MHKDDISEVYDEIKSMKNEGKKHRKNLKSQTQAIEELDSVIHFKELQVELNDESPIIFIDSD